MKIKWSIVPEILNATEFFVILRYFLSIYLSNNLNNQNFENMKKTKKKSLVTSSFYTCIPHMKITQCMIHEMWSTTDWIFCHFGLFFALLPHKTQKIKILKKWKKACILHKCTKKIIICYTVPEILWVTDVTFILGYFYKESNLISVGISGVN